LVPPDDHEAFADALAQVLDAHETRDRMAAASQASGAALQNWDCTARLVADVLNRIAKDARDGR
jgi:glycosyltransferase involved in cell wall biosynthesis